MAYATDISAIRAAAPKAGVFRTLFARIAQYRTYRATFNELSSMGDRELADIGLSRSQIRSIAYEHSYDVKR